MARRNTLTYDISPKLREAMGLAVVEGEVDYFALMGVAREAPEPAAVAEAVQSRTKVLRQWHTSAEYGREAVMLLRVVQQAGKILRDPKRRDLYLRELAKAAGGETVSAVDEFREMARAALADDVISSATRNALTQFAESVRLDQATVAQVTREVRQELAASRQAETPDDAAGEWEFKLAGEGEEPFLTELHAMTTSGHSEGLTPQRMLQKSAAYGIAPERAAELIEGFQRTRYDHMVQRVAGVGVLTQIQADLLLTKAGTFGLDVEQAAEIVSNYSLSVVGGGREAIAMAGGMPDEGEDENSAMFAAIEVDENELAVHYSNRSSWSRMLDPLRMHRRALMVTVIVVVVIVAGVAFLVNRPSAAPRRHTTPPSQEPVAQAPDTVATPQPIESHFIAPADPASGRIRLDPERPGDASSFEISIHEVTCAQYARFLRATDATPPEGWTTDGTPPSGATQTPVVGVSWHDAMAYCTWFARSQGLPSGSVRLPRHKEYLRALRGRTTRGRSDQADVWRRNDLHRAARVRRVRTARFDRIFFGERAEGRQRIFGGGGVAYDLLGNVAEWGADELGRQRAVLGGDFTQDSPDFDPTKVRWLPADTTQPHLGFRCVVVQ